MPDYRYEPVRAHDAPDILFTQLMQGELTGSSVMKTLLRPNDLSIEERDSYADKLKESLGNHSISNALVDVAKNPFFWMLMLTSPVGGRTLSRGKKLFFDGGERLSMYVRENEGLFGFMKFLTANEYYSGTAVPAAMGGISKALDTLHRERRAVLESLNKWGEKRGMTRGLNPKDYPDDPEKAAVLEKLWYGLFGAFTKRADDVIQPIADLRGTLEIYKKRDGPLYDPVTGVWQDIGPADEVIELGTKDAARRREKIIFNHDDQLSRGSAPPIHFRETQPELYISKPTDKWSQRKGWGGDDPEMVLDSIGAGDVWRSYQKLRKDYYIRSFLTPYQGPGHRDMAGQRYTETDLIHLEGEPVPFVVNDANMLKIWRAHKSELFKRGKLDADESVPMRGMAMLKELISRETSMGTRMESMNWPDFLATVRRLVKETVNPNTYLPRNVVEVLGVDGKAIVPEMVRSANRGDQLFASQRTTSRTQADVRWHPDDKEAYGRVMNVPPESRLWNEVRNTRREMKEVLAEHGQVPVHRIDPIEAMERYMKDMDETHVLFSMDPSDEYLRHQKEYYKRSKSSQRKRRHQQPAPLPDGTQPEAALLETPFMDVHPNSRPLGGFSYADGLWAEHQLFNNAGARETLEAIILPTTLGRLSSANKTGLIASGLAKNAAKWFIESPFKKMIGDAGEWGEHFVARAGRIAEKPLQELMTSRDIASYLYVTHLGVNMASVMLNMMQPLLLGVPWLGGRHILQGYRKAIGEMSDYFKNRRGLPLRISDMERDALIRKSFKWGGKETGEDLLDIHGSIIHTVDAIGAEQSSFRRPGWFEYLKRDAPLKLFEKAEWLNRLVMSHAAESAVRAQGMRDPINIARNVSDMIRQTQYGAHVMNTPLFMLPMRPPGGGGRAKNWFSDPTMRQFMMFPLRTLTGFMHAPMLIAGEKHHPVAAVLQTWVRALGTGAVAHAVLKNTLGADMSRGLAPYAPLDIFSGERFIEGAQGSLPVALPPVIDIAGDTLAWAMGAGDDQMVRRWATRMIPGGVGLGRALSMVPSPDTDYGLGRLARSLQGHYVDWGAPRQDGMVPVMKSDGTLVRYAKPSTMILRALGMDMRKFSTEAEVDRWLSRNRDEFSKMRREFITSVLNSDWDRANSLQAKSQKKFGIPIKFSRSQLSTQMRTRTITRTERLLDRMSPDLRERYIKAVQHKAPELGLTPEQMGQTTASQRTKAGAQRPAPLSEEAQKYLRAYMSQDPGTVFERYGE
jgi:hypothetical protein